MQGETRKEAAVVASFLLLGQSGEATLEQTFVKLNATFQLRLELLSTTWVVCRHNPSHTKVGENQSDQRRRSGTQGSSDVGVVVVRWRHLHKKQLVSSGGVGDYFIQHRATVVGYQH